MTVHPPPLAAVFAGFLVCGISCNAGGAILASLAGTAVPMTEVTNRVAVAPGDISKLRFVTENGLSGIEESFPRNSTTGTSTANLGASVVSCLGTKDVLSELRLIPQLVTALHIKVWAGLPLRLGFLLLRPPKGLID